MGLVAAAGVGGYFVKHPRPAPIGFEVTPKELRKARALLARHISVDAHAHPGRTFVDGAENLSGQVWVYAQLGTFERRTLADMQAGGLSAAAFAAVSDFQALGTAGGGLAAVNFPRLSQSGGTNGGWGARGLACGNWRR